MEDKVKVVDTSLWAVDVLRCAHQYFEIKKLCEYHKPEEGSSINWVAIPKRQGVLVKCALCEEEKELWQSEV